MKEIEAGLHRVHAEARETKSSAMVENMDISDATTTAAAANVAKAADAIVKVDRVDADSPASSAVSLRKNCRHCTIQYNTI